MAKKKDKKGKKDKAKKQKKQSKNREAATMQIDLDLVRQKLESQLEGYEGFHVTVNGDAIELHCDHAPWSPHPYEGPDDMASLIAQAILENAWRSHSQYLAGLFGEHRVRPG